MPGALVYSPPPPNDCEPTPADLSSEPVDFAESHTFPGSTTAGLCNVATLVLTVTNDGGRPATINSVVVQGVSDSVLDFNGIENCNASSPLAYTQSCTITATFCPQAPGALSGVVDVTYQDATGIRSESIILQGTGIP